MGRGQGPTPDTDVLVVGAGPAGLTTALQAQAHGASVRVVDRRPHLTRLSRALMLHARALEGLRPLAVTGELLRRADTTPRKRGSTWAGVSSKPGWATRTSRTRPSRT